MLTILAIKKKYLNIKNINIMIIYAPIVTH